MLEAIGKTWLGGLTDRELDSKTSGRSEVVSIGVERLSGLAS